MNLQMTFFMLLIFSLRSAWAFLRGWFMEKGAGGTWKVLFFNMRLKKVKLVHLTIHLMTACCMIAFNDYM